MKVLVATQKPFAPVAVEGIRKIVTEAGYDFALLEKYAGEADLVAAVADADALIVRSDKVTAAVVAAAPKLRIVVRAGAGYDNLDLAACSARGVVAMNTPGQNSNAVAELAIAMMIYMSRGQFTPSTGSEINGRTLGVQAFGNVGRLVARKAEALGKIRPLDAETRALSRTLEKKLMPEFIPAEHSVRECELREEMVKLINRSYNRMLSFSTDGTFSARVSQDQFLVTPKGLDRMNLRNDELVLIQDNYREMGKIPSRAAGFFKAIYDTHPWVNAIIVSKPVNVMGYAVTEEKIDTKTIPESYILLRDIVDIPCAEHYKDPISCSATIAC